MNFKTIFTYVILLFSFYSCKKDLGNYSYSPVSEPIVVNFKDATFPAMVGDTLTLMPYIQFEDGDYLKDLSYEWEIVVDEEARAVKYTGYPLKMVYNLNPKVRNAKLTITDNRNGIKYFIPFKISGNTQFSVGKTVLSVENGITKLSFIKSDDKTILTDLYQSINGEELPLNPVQLFAKPIAYLPGTVEEYWVICQDPTKSSVMIDASSMLRKKYLPEHFFNPPATIIPGYFEASKGIPSAVMNDKLFIAATSTAPFAPDFGKFANPQPGDYNLSKFFSVTPQFYFGFDMKSKGFVSFGSDGAYTGSEYTVEGNAFNPKNIGMTNLLYMSAVSGTSYAFFKDDAGDGTGTVHEFSFGIDMNDYQNRKVIKPDYRRVFNGASLVRSDTKWQRSPTDVFYFTSDDKIYRYNPINENLTQLVANFAGKKVTMMQLSQDGNTLTAGVEGAIMTLDVSVGKMGNITKTITGIPGTPIDIVIKDN